MTVVRASIALPSALQAALAAGTTVVTPNKRLARRLAAISDDAQRASGRAVWPVPVVLPWASWVERLWLDVLASDANVVAPRRFTAAQGAYTWKETVAAGSCPKWFTLSGPTERDTRVTSSSGIKRPCEDRT